MTPTVWNNIICLFIIITLHFLFILYSHFQIPISKLKFVSLIWIQLYKNFNMRCTFCIYLFCYSTNITPLIKFVLNLLKEKEPINLLRFHNSKTSPYNSIYFIFYTNFSVVEVCLVQDTMAHLLDKEFLQYMSSLAAWGSGRVKRLTCGSLLRS
jgi:hypothetical protein